MKNKINKTKQEIISLLLGRPEDTTAREAHWRIPRHSAAHAGLPPQPRRLMGGARASARQSGERSGRRRSSSPVAPPVRSAVHRCSSQHCASSGDINFGYHHGKRGGDGHGGARPRHDRLPARRRRRSPIWRPYELQWHALDLAQDKGGMARDSSSTAGCELGRRRSWRPGGATLTGSST